MTCKIHEEIKTDIAFASSQATSGKRSEVYVDMSVAQRVAAVIVVQLTEAHSAAVQLYQAKTAAGGSAKVLGDAVTFTNTVGDGYAKRDIICRVEAAAADLDGDNGFTHVGVNVDTTESALAAGVFIRSGLMFRDGIDQDTQCDTGTVTTTSD